MKTTNTKNTAAAADSPTDQARIAALEARVERLERVLGDGDGAAPAAPAGADDRFWALDALRERLPDGDGAVLYTGVAPLPSGEHYEWQVGALTSEVFADDWGELAEVLQALANPVRLALLRAVLDGVDTVAALAELEASGTTGQVYHHVRQLTAVGWLQTTGRGRYGVPGPRVVPLLVILAAARR